MSSVVISGDTSGTVSLTVPSVAGTNTATLPAATGTVMVSGNMPAFSVYRTGTQGSFASSTYTKVQLNTEEFDTNSNFDSTTNYRFTPTVAGYYQINAGVVATGTNLSYLQAIIYKNGSPYKTGNYTNSTSAESGSFVAGLVYCNGSTDYIELYAYLSVSSGTGTIYGGGSIPVTQTYMNGSLVRSA